MTNKRERETEAVEAARRHLRHIEEQIEKRQYWNSIWATNELQKSLLQAFDSVLKESP